MEAGDLTRWCLAECVPGIGNRERALIVIASVSPDADGLGIVVELATRPPPWRWR